MVVIPIQAAHRLQFLFADIKIETGCFYSTSTYRMTKIDTSKASAARVSGKSASDTFKQGNNAGMLFKKQAKAATTVDQYTSSLQCLRSKEIERGGDGLRKYAGEK